MPSMDEIKEKLRDLFAAQKVTETIEEYLPNVSAKTFFAGIGVFFVACAIGGCALFSWLSDNETEDGSLPIYVKVKSGMNARDIGAMLTQRGIISNRYGFWLKAKLNGYEDKFKTGSYAFHKNMETEEVLNMLVEGSVTVFKFTIPEGFTVKDIAKRLHKEGIADEKEFLALAKNFAPYDYMEKAKYADFRAEGFLFPDTYTIDTDATAEDIMAMMARDFDNRLDRDLRARAKKMGLSIYELVTLASLVEKEARFEEDRAIIAQVLLKRLDMHMPLQSDATLQYLMDAPKEDVSIDDTKIDSPYNSYQHIGLPPGPIANPGLASIEAVLYPAETDYLYFVADREGHNHYSYTYDEHLAIVNEVR